jgi:3-oxoacyl-[acyl-carrier-protein] synthase II
MTGWRRVVVTGLGLVTPLGLEVEAVWEALVGGRSAVGPIQGFDPGSLHARLGAEVTGFDAGAHVENRRNLRLMTRADQLCFAAARLAVGDAGLDPKGEEPARAAVYVGGAKEICKPESLREPHLAARGPEGDFAFTRFAASAFSTTHPLFYLEGLPGAPLFYISQDCGWTGANCYFPGTAEAGSTALGAAFRAVRRGEAEVALAGGFDDAVSWWNLTKLDGLDLLTDANQLGVGACRPFDRARGGAVLGEGAAFLMVEERERALRRGARIWSEMLGFGSAFDAGALLRPDPGGREVAAGVRGALRDAGLDASQVGYVAAHASGTRLGDPSEALGLVGALGPAPLASSVKAATGHLGAAAGALNAAVAVLALDRQRVPPTLNLTDPDPACPVDGVALQAREVTIDHSLAVARGLEGQCSVLAFGRA